MPFQFDPNTVYPLSSVLIAVVAFLGFMKIYASSKDVSDSENRSTEKINEVKSEVSALKAEIAEKYTLKEDVEKRLDKFEADVKGNFQEVKSDIKRMSDKLDSSIERIFDKIDERKTNA